jgi:transcriptional regulator with XRE-family HTH domain
MVAPWATSQIGVGGALDFGKIKQIRERLGLTQEEAAKKAGFSNRQYWNNIESGRRTNIELNTLDAIARALKVSAKDLLK